MCAAEAHRPVGDERKGGTSRLSLCFSILHSSALPCRERVRERERERENNVRILRYMYM